MYVCVWGGENIPIFFFFILEVSSLKFKRIVIMKSMYEMDI